MTAIRVLVVDDEPSPAELVSTMLRMEGWEVRTAADGDGAAASRRSHSAPSSSCRWPDW